MQKTEKLKLNLLEDKDPVLVEPFNENSAILEELCSSMPRVHWGSYMGDGSDSVTMTFPKKPVLVLLQSRFTLFLCLHGLPPLVFEASASRYRFAEAGTYTWDDANNQLILQSVTAYKVSVNGEKFTYLAFLEA